MRVLLAVLGALVWAACLELIARGYWTLHGDVPLLAPDRILQAIYPELRSLDAAPPTAGDASLDILLLGGSTLHEAWGQVEVELREQLARAGHRDVRTFNLAQPAHTSRDSRLKYEALPDARFDYVVFCHGINEARANNVPPELFRDDYSHFAWYETANALASHHGRSRLALPYTVRLAVLRTRQALYPQRYVPEDRPRRDWLRYGGEIRSARSFEDNLRTVLEVAERRRERVVVLTFATWIPPDYSLDAFRAKRLDYLLFYSPLELWGEAANVVAAVAAHNAIARRLGAREGVLLVDQERLMPKGGRYFNDPCHLTVEGSARFARHLADALLQDLPPPP